MAKNITPRDTDYSQWYQDVIKAGEMAENSPVRGCMVIRPSGYAIWERIQQDLDRRFKETGHVNAYFPLFIPKSFLEKEAEHVDGFALECAVVTHSGLESGNEGLTPSKPLAEPLIVRPTSETIIGHMYANWIQSYRDLPVLMNQWANVCRWEMRTRLFLRTSEFLWQEGHTAHAQVEEAIEETVKMLHVYRDFAQDFLAIPVVVGKKSASEKFPGAVDTYCIEALMQDNKALQAGTSHFLGDNFAKAFDIKFLGDDNEQHYCQTTSWGVSTRLVGALIMTHSDDEGLVLPPKVAPYPIAIVPMGRKDEDKAKVQAYIEDLLVSLCGQDALDLAKKVPGSQHMMSLFLPQSQQQIVVDWREIRPVEKHFYWEQRGVPLRFEIGPRDVENQKVVVKTRWDGSKSFEARDDISLDWIEARLEEIQQALFQRAQARLTENTVVVDSKEELYHHLENRDGFVVGWFAEDIAVEKQIKEDTNGTVRAMVYQDGAEGTCIFSGQPTGYKAYFAVAY